MAVYTQCLCLISSKGDGVLCISRMVPMLLCMYTEVFCFMHLNYGTDNVGIFSSCLTDLQEASSKSNEN